MMTLGFRFLFVVTARPYLGNAWVVTKGKRRRSQATAKPQWYSLGPLRGTLYASDPDLLAESPRRSKAQPSRGFPSISRATLLIPKELP